MFKRVREIGTRSAGWQAMLCALVLVTVAASSTATAAPIISEQILSNYFFLGDMHTYEYASKVDFRSSSIQDYTFNGVYIGTSSGLPGSLAWAHTLPAGLSVPPDAIDRAKLWVDGWLIDGNNNAVEIQGTLDWDPLSSDFLDNSSYWLTDVDVPGFWNDGTLDVTVTAGEVNLRIDYAILMMDYTPGGASNPDPVPEPGTIALLGSGIVGLGALRLRRSKKS